MKTTLLAAVAAIAFASSPASAQYYYPQSTFSAQQFNAGAGSQAAAGGNVNGGSMSLGHMSAADSWSLGTAAVTTRAMPNSSGTSVQSFQQGGSRTLGNGVANYGAGSSAWGGSNANLSTTYTFQSYGGYGGFGW